MWVTLLRPLEVAVSRRVRRFWRRLGRSERSIVRVLIVVEEGGRREAAAASLVGLEETRVRMEGEEVRRIWEAVVWPRPEEPPKIRMWVLSSFEGGILVVVVVVVGMVRFWRWRAWWCWFTSGRGDDLCIRKL